MTGPPGRLEERETATSRDDDRDQHENAEQGRFEVNGKDKRAVERAQQAMPTSNNATYDIGSSSRCTKRACTAPCSSGLECVLLMLAMAGQAMPPREPMDTAANTCGAGQMALLKIDLERWLRIIYTLDREGAFSSGK